jgi:putative oxidoreductase
MHQARARHGTGSGFPRVVDGNPFNRQEPQIVNSFESRLASLAPYFLALLRVIAALLFLSHGTMKLLGFPASDFQPPLFSLFGLAGAIEIVAGVLIIIGLFTRVAAFIASGQMAVAYFMAHAPQAFVPAQNGGEAAVLFCFVFLYLVFAGPGAFAIDNARRA